MTHEAFDVVIVGAGPSGSSTAYWLANQGFRVCVLEKYIMPRYKTCGGGVNVRALQHIPFSIETVVERVVSTYRFTYRGEQSFERRYPLPLTYMTQRSRLDRFLMDKSCDAGAELRQGVTVRRVTQDTDSVTVEAGNGLTLSARVVVGADGAHSVVARDGNLMRDMRHEVALESEIVLTNYDMEKWGDVIEVDLFTLKYGYGWVFPKAKHISVGVGGLRADMQSMQRYNAKYLEQHTFEGQTVTKFSGHALPIRRKGSILVNGRTLLVGDAAGLLEPFTGEGIGYAVWSGQLASVAIASYLQGKSDSLQYYQEILESEIMPELALAQTYVHLFNLFPRAFYHLIRKNDYVWNSACKVLRGERSFADVDRRLGLLRHLVNALT